MPPAAVPITVRTAWGSRRVRIEQLEYVAAVTRHGSLRRASGHLHVSQPAVSEAIRKLERELGVTLLERSRTGSTISAAGRELLQPIVEVLDAVARLRAAAGDQLASRRHLRVGTVAAGTASLALPALRSFQAAHQDVLVELRTLQQGAIEAGLAEGRLDLGLLNLLEGDDVPPELAVDVLLTGRPVAVVPAGHRLASADAVGADDLRRERFVAMRSGYLMHRFAHRLFGADVPPDQHTTDGAELGKLMVAEGIGVTVLPDYSVVGDPLERGGLIVTRPLLGDRTTVTLVAVHRRQSRPSARVEDFLAQLRTTAGRSGTDAVRACS